MPPVDVKSVRLSGSDPGGCVTSTRNVAVAGATAGAEGVPVSVTVAFCVTGAFDAAVIVTVTLCPGEKTVGENDAVVPGGKPLTDGVMSKSTLELEPTLEANSMEPEPPIGTATSRDRG